MQNTKSKTAVLAECAIMIALATVLSKVEIPLWLQGGSITLASMTPIVLVSYRHGTKWGLSTAFVYSVFQMFLGFKNVLYCKTLTTQILCVLMDYILAYSALGFAYSIGKLAKSKKSSIILGTSSVCFIRFICSFISGILIWYEYAPADKPLWFYSLTYNGGYMLPELIITASALLLLSKFIPEKVD